MQLVVLAYVSSGSFISLAEDPCRTFPGQRDGAEEPKGPTTAAMPEEGCEKTIMVLLFFFVELYAGLL